MFEVNAAVALREGTEKLARVIHEIQEKHGPNAVIGCWAFVNSMLWDQTLRNAPREMAEDALSLMKEGMAVAGIDATFTIINLNNNEEAI